MVILDFHKPAQTQAMLAMREAAPNARLHLQISIRATTLSFEFTPKTGEGNETLDLISKHVREH